MTGETRQRRGFAVRPVERFGSSLAPPSRYDLVLWLIPAAFLLALLTSVTLAVSLHAALLGASLIGVLVIADAIALNPPSAS